MEENQALNAKIDQQRAKVLKLRDAFRSESGVEKRWTRNALHYEMEKLAKLIERKGK
jgi:hypothetical protein